jgi:hypothetical protein
MNRIGASTSQMTNNHQLVKQSQKCPNVLQYTKSKTNPKQKHKHNKKPLTQTIKIQIIKYNIILINLHHLQCNHQIFKIKII